jgi:CRISPR-associated Csx2 family protein
LSFLGNNYYQQCRYSLDGFESPVVRFFQEALINLLFQDWKETDQIFIFLTSAAEKNNWEGQFYEGKGLKQALNAYEGLSINAIKDIPTGISEKEIWLLVERLYACLTPNDIVYLDITHGFRSLPMLLMVLLDYAKALKQIQVQKIYYGAFEVLGSTNKIATHFPNPSDRIVPILDLTSFSALQDWTIAASDFKFYGKSNRLQFLIQNSLDPLLKKSNNNQNDTALLLHKVNQQIQHLIPLIQTNRGNALNKFSFDDLKHLITQLLTTENILQPLKAVLGEMQTKIQPFTNADSLIWLKTAEWCHQHGLIQQAITQLQEGLLTFFCGHFKQSIDLDFFDFTKDRPRRLIANTFNIINYNIGRKKWNSINLTYKQWTRVIEADALFQQTAPWYRQLTNLRNDINHGGYQHFAAPSVFYTQLEDCIKALRLILNKNAPKPLALTVARGLVNISAFPFDEWSPTHQSLIRQEYQKVTDLLFPEDIARLNEADFQALIASYYKKILLIRPQAVHVLGEITFTYGLVERLKKAGIPCFAAIWEVEEHAQANLQTANWVGFRHF